jgi:hypothetical protein
MNQVLNTVHQAVKAIPNREVFDLFIVCRGVWDRGS